MRFVLSAWLLVTVFWAACAYDDRSYDNVVFSCDLFHPCPDGVACVAGKCAGGGGTGTGQQGVICGGSLCPLTMSCCNSGGIGGLRCMPLGSCSTLSLEEVACDGREDCGPASSCCTDGFDGTECAPGCDADDLICSTNADCPGIEPYCCPSLIFDLPFRVCDSDPC